MTYIESLKYVKENDSAVFAVNVKKKELITIVYDQDPENFSDIIVRYSKELGPGAGEEESYSPEEFEEEFEGSLNDYDFISCKKDITELLDYDFEAVLEEMNDYKLPE